MLNCKLLVLVILAATNNCTIAQQQRWQTRASIDPGLCFSALHHSVKTGNTVTSEVTRPAGLFFGIGAELLHAVPHSIYIGLNGSFIAKGYLARKYIYNDGINSGSEYERVDLNFLEATLFAERQWVLKDPNHALLLSGGLFGAFPSPKAISFRLKARGSDFGTCIAAGLRVKRFYGKLSFKKGLIHIANSDDVHFKTTVLGFNLGCYLRKLH